MLGTFAFHNIIYIGFILRRYTENPADGPVVARKPEDKAMIPAKLAFMWHYYN